MTLMGSYRGMTGYWNEYGTLQQIFLGNPKTTKNPELVLLKKE